MQILEDGPSIMNFDCQPILDGKLDSNIPQERTTKEPYRGSGKFLVRKCTS